MIQIKTKKYRKLAMGGPWDGVPETYTDNGVNGTGELSYTGTDYNTSTVPSMGNTSKSGQGMGGLGNMGSSIVDAGIQLGSAAIVAQAQKKETQTLLIRLMVKTGLCKVPKGFPQAGISETKFTLESEEL